MKKILAAILCALFALVPLSACGESGEGKTTIRLNEVTHSVFYAPMYAAEALGYFEEENIEIELTNGGGADAVMAGGMIPPLAIALCTTFFKNRFTKKERESGIVNYLLGLSFISEGAIPFAASDPLRVIPSCIVGSAVAGGLSMFFGCTLRAPHGGIFVLPTIGNPLMYALAILIGAVAGCLVLAALKRPIKDNAIETAE